MRTLSFSFMTLVFSLAACAPGGTKQARGSEDFVRPLADDVAIIKYDGGVISGKDVAAQVQPQLKGLQEEAIEAYKNAARQVLLERLIDEEAKKTGMTREQMIQGAMANHTVTDAQVTEFMKKNNLEKGFKNPQTGKMEKVSREQVSGYLKQQGMQEVQRKFIGDLLVKANYQVLLEVPAVEIKTPAESPFLGGADAKVVVQEWSDFECPFCEQARGVVRQLKDHYGDKVKVVFRHFPLSNHPNARPAAQASHCAAKQGKFWEFHDKIFDNFRSLNASVYEPFAKELGLDLAAFNTCLADPATAAFVSADMAEGERAGVRGTPSFFVNGRKMSGLSFADFKTVIDSELAKR